MHAVGIDIGGTKIAAALVDESGQILREARVATPMGDGDEIVRAVVALVEELAAGESGPKSASRLRLGRLAARLVRTLFRSSWPATAC